MRDIHFFSPEAFELWDYRNPDTQGIGGSETSQIEMAWRLARRSYNVTCYSPLPDDCRKQWRGTEWRHVDSCDFSAPGLWLFYRCPKYLDRFPAREDQQAWVICQDEDYAFTIHGEHWYAWTPERVAKITRVVALCNAQAQQFLERYPDMRGKVCVSSNGLKPELAESILAEQHPRDPLRLMYASSPDRALLPLMKVFRRAKEFVPGLQLHLAYGFDNIDKIIAKVEAKETKTETDKRFLRDLDMLKALLNTPGVFWHGRLNQAELYREWSKTGIWCYPCSRFRETSCITSMEAQALGAIPVVSPLWAVGENVRHGVHVDGDHDDPLTIARFAAEVVRLALDPERQEEIRQEMIPEARRLFSWERFCDQWEAWVHGYADGERATDNQYAFQLRHAEGRILNVGCNDDAANLKAFGAINVDLFEVDSFTDRPLKADLILDARDLPDKFAGQFDTVVLGDILEHFEDGDAAQALGEAVRCLKPGGKVIVTCPEDHRQQDAEQEYAPGIHAYHFRPVTQDMIARWLGAAGLLPVFHRPIDYGFAWGHGFVARPVIREGVAGVDAA